MRSFIWELALAAVGVVIAALVTRIGEAMLTLIIAIGGFVPHADPRMHVVVWMLSVYAAAGAVSGLFLELAARRVANSPSPRRRMRWILGSALLWAGLGALTLFLDSAWQTPLFVRSSAPWLAPSAAVAGALVILLAVRSKRELHSRAVQ